MAQLGSEDIFDFAIYTPPLLPPCIADTYPLEPIVGVPNATEVKAIHAATRALNGILSAPALYDADLPMQLAQHLFEAQMAVYRSQHNSDILPSDAVYTPPPLPSYIPANLEAIIGAPSDEELKSVQKAVQAAENLANNPAIFDPDLSMNLSQHLFNIQTARYIQQSIQGKFAPKTKPAPPFSEELERDVSKETESVYQSLVDLDSLIDAQRNPNSPHSEQAASASSKVEENWPSCASPAGHDTSKKNLVETQRLLEEMRGVLKGYTTQDHMTSGAGRAPLPLGQGEQVSGKLGTGLPPTVDLASLYDAQEEPVMAYSEKSSAFDHGTPKAKQFIHDNAPILAMSYQYIRSNQKQTNQLLAKLAEILKSILWMLVSTKDASRNEEMTEIPLVPVNHHAWFLSPRPSQLIYDDV